MRRYHLPERLPEVLVLLLSLLLSLSLAWAVHRWEAEQRTERIRENVAVYVQAIGQQLQSLVTAVQSLAQFYSASDAVQADAFIRFARPFLERNPAIQALGWVPQVRAAGRAAFEAQARADGADGFAIREQVGADLNPAAPRPEYFPVWRVIPLADNARSLGFDLGSEPRRRAALEQARDSGQAVATAPVTLIQETANQRGILIFVPVGGAEDLGATVQQRREGLRGFALGAMRIGTMIERTIAALPPLGLDLVLRDATLPGAAGLLHVHSSRTRGPAMALDAAVSMLDDADAQEAHLAVAGRTLSLRATPAPGAYPTSGWPWLVLGLGLVISAALFALLRYRRQAVARLREREERLRLFIEYAPAALALFDRELRYLAASRRWRTNFGLGDRPLLGESHYAIFPELPAAWREAHRRGLAGEVLRADADRFERRDGSVQWVRWEIHPWHAADGRVAGIAIFSEDITEQQQATEALAASEERLRLALDAARMGSYDWDLVARRFTSSPQLERLWGFAPGECDGTEAAFTGRVHPDDLPRRNAELARCLTRAQTRGTAIASLSADRGDDR